MQDVEVRRHAAAPVEQVWAVATDLAGAPRVVRGIDAVEVLTPGKSGVGTRRRETRTMLGRSATEEMAGSRQVSAPPAAPRRRAASRASAVRCGTVRLVSEDWRPLGLRRDGVCSACGAALAAGTEAMWSRSAGAVRCAEHAVDPTARPQAAADAPSWRTLTLQRPAACAICGADLGPGTSAQWDRSRRLVRCLAHDAANGDGEVPAPTGAPATAPHDRGAAGGSAHAEYERRKARREQRVRDAHPVLGGLILALSDEPQHVAAWRQGAAGERAVARRLDRLVDRGVAVLHDRRIPGTKANIDHLAVSSSGVYVIDAKNYTGTVRVAWEGGLSSPRRYKLTVGRRDATELVVGVQRQTGLVREVLAGDPQLLDEVVVTGVLAFFDADWPLFPPDRIEDVRLEGPRSTTKLVLRDGPYGAAEVALIANRLAAHFPAYDAG